MYNNFNMGGSAPWVPLQVTPALVCKQKASLTIANKTIEIESSLLVIFVRSTS